LRGIGATPLRVMISDLVQLWQAQISLLSKQHNYCDEG
jgi:hypothetical protein